MKAVYTYDYVDRPATLDVEGLGSSVMQSIVTSADYLPSGPLESLDLGNGLTETRVLADDPSRDAALTRSIKTENTKRFYARRGNCTTACGDALRAAGVLEPDDRPERGLLFDSPKKLQESLDSGALSTLVDAKVIFDPNNVKTVTPEQIKVFLGIEDRQGGHGN